MLLLKVLPRLNQKQRCSIGLDVCGMRIIKQGLSSQDISTLFKHISSDNEIAEKFKIGWTNLMYINNFGLALYFKELPYSKIKVSNWFVILYDESLNKITQQCLL